MSITGEADGEPQKVGVAVVDLMTGVYATTAILAALQRRAQTGLGCHIDAALLDVQVAMLANQASNYLVSGKAPRRMGNAHPNIVPYQAFPTADGHLVLAVGNDGQFQRFCAEAGAADLATDPDYATNADRVRHRTALVAQITELLAADTTVGWVARLEAAGVPCSPILNIDQVFDDPQVQARGMALGGGDQAPGVATPMLFDGLRPCATRPAPQLDADAGSVQEVGWLSAGSGESRS
jgi:crotonobetainyl-CoA:carnitine CoA-transferase CaiB-like acyl-CoA transferase